MKKAYRNFEFCIDNLPVIALKEKVGVAAKNLAPLFRLEVDMDKISKLASNWVTALEIKVRHDENVCKVKVDDNIKARIVGIIKDFVEKMFESLPNTITSGYYHFNMSCSFKENSLCVDIYENTSPDESIRQQVLGTNIFVKKVENVTHSYTVFDTLGREFKFSGSSTDLAASVQIKYRTHNFLVLKNNEIEHVVHFVSIQKVEDREVVYSLGDEP